MAVDTMAIYEYLYHPDQTSAQQPDLERLESTRFSLLTIVRAMARAGSFRSRIHTLVFSGGHPPSTALRITTSMMIDIVRAHLQHLELHMYTDNAFNSIVGVPRSLDTVFLLEPNWEEIEYVPYALIAARQLTFQRTSPWRDEDLNHLGLYQTITELRLIWSPTSGGEPSSFEVEPFSQGTHTRHSVLLPSVTTLYIRGAIPFRILDPLKLPILTTIEVRNHDFRQPLSTVQSTTLHHTVTQLVVRFTLETADGWGDALAAILAEAPQLQMLVASRWMEGQLSVDNNVKIELV